MLVKTDFKNQFRSTYVCDRCGKIVDVQHKVGIYLQRYLTNSRKYCDLCLRCYKSFCRSIEKGKKNGND